MANTTKAKKKESPNKVSDETINQTIELTEDGLKVDSDEAKELEKQRDFLGRIAKPSFDAAKNARRKYDQEWIARNLFARGYQFSRYLPQTQTVVLSGRQNARVPINLTTAHMRAIRNQVTSFRPKWETMPRTTSSEVDKVQARYTGRLLDYYWDHLHLKMKTKETITQALMYSVGGPWKIEWDKIKKRPKIRLRDTFDFFIDPLAEEFNDEDPEYCVEAIRQSHSEVYHNPNFSIFARKEVAGGDASLAASEYKQFMIQAIRTISPRTNENSPTVILKDGYFKRRRDTGEVYMVRCIWTDQNLTPLYYEELETDEFPFVLYKGDLNPKDIYGESWIKHVMAVNRVINSLESSAFEYNYRVAKGRIVVDKDSGVKQIHNVHGEIISKNRGSEVKALDMSPLPVAVPDQIQRMWRYMEDVSGIHEASLGRLPTGAKCVDLSTKCLTKKGFVTMDQLRNGDEIYTVNQKTLKGEWQPLIAIHKYEDYQGEIYRFNNRNIDAVVTPNHKWLVKRAFSGQHLLVETNTAMSEDKVLLGARYEQGKVDKVYSDEFVELVGWVLTEGTYRKEKSWRISISQSYKANPEKCERIITTVSKNTNDFFLLDEEKTDALRVCFSKDLGKKIREMFPDKVLTYDFVNSLTVEQMEILKKAMVLGDGNIRGNNERFFNTEQRMIDVFVYMCVLLGYTCHVKWYQRSKNPKLRDYAEVSIKRSKYTMAFYKSKKDKESFVKVTNEKLYVWCPETVNGTFIAERNGKIYVTGNSGIAISQLQSADSNSQDDLVDNLEDFLEEVARKLLKVISENMDGYQIIRDLGTREGEEKYFVAIGEQFNKKKGKKGIPGHENQIKMGADWFDIAEIANDNHIRVNVGSWLGYTKEAMQQKVIQYYQLQLIDQNTALKLLEFGDIDTIVQQSRLEALLKRPPQQGANGQPQTDQFGLAMTENEMMLEGKNMPVSENDDHIVHIALHQEALGRGADHLIGLHIDKHMVYLNSGQTQGNTGNGMSASLPGQTPTAPSQGPQAPQGSQAPTQPSNMPSPQGMPSAPSPMGMPPGQGQAQQQPSNVPVGGLGQ